jgi:Transposase DDE domain
MLFQNLPDVTLGGSLARHSRHTDRDRDRHRVNCCLPDSAAIQPSGALPHWCERKQQARTMLSASWLLLITTLEADAWPRADVFALYRARWQIEIRFKRLKQLVRLHGLPSFDSHANEAILALTLMGWVLLGRQERRVRERLPAVSAWHGGGLWLHTFRIMLWGCWSWEMVEHQLDALRRYLRPSRPPERLWSDRWLRTHLQRLLESA